MTSLREEVAGISNQHNQTALNLWVTSNIGELQNESSTNANHHTNQQTAKEDEQENADTLKEVDKPVGLLRLGFVLLSSLEDDNGDGIIEDGFAKNDRVQFRVDFVGVEDGQDSDRVGSRERRADRNGVNERHIEPPQRYPSIQP